MNPEEIKLELISSRNSSNDLESTRRLMLKLKKEKSDIVLEGLLEFFFYRELFPYQKIAGGFLWLLKPEYKRNLREDIIRSFGNWDMNVEELPWYYAEVLGIDTVRREIISLLTEPFDEATKYYAYAYMQALAVDDPDSVRVELNLKWKESLKI